jgi:hypothetical protein
LVIDGNVVNSTAAFDKLGINIEYFLNFCCQTGSTRKIVSGAAVLD